MSIDAFVSSSEIVLNNRVNNPNFQESMFYRIPAKTISSLSFEVRKKCVRVIVSRQGEDPLALDVNTKLVNAEEIRSAFLSLETEPTVHADETNIVNVFE